MVTAWIWIQRNIENLYWPKKWTRNCHCCPYYFIYQKSLPCCINLFNRLNRQINNNAARNDPYTIISNPLRKLLHIWNALTLFFFSFDCYDFKLFYSRRKKLHNKENKSCQQNHLAKHKQITAIWFNHSMQRITEIFSSTSNVQNNSLTSFLFQQNAIKENCRGTRTDASKDVPKWQQRHEICCKLMECSVSFSWGLSRGIVAKILALFPRWIAKCHHWPVWKK
jgi:hypothetical protein